jgi:hypothetical protein
MQGRSTSGRIVAPVSARAQRSWPLPNFHCFLLHQRLRIKWILCRRFRLRGGSSGTDLVAFSVFLILMVGLRSERCALRRMRSGERGNPTAVKRGETLRKRKAWARVFEQQGFAIISGAGGGVTAGPPISAMTSWSLQNATLPGRPEK